MDTESCVCFKGKKQQDRTNLKPRPIEVQAFQVQVETSEFHRQIVHLWNVSRMPGRYPQIEDKPRRALGGNAQLKWVAKRMAINPTEVRLWVA